MTMLDRVGSFNNEYFNSLIREYTDKGQRPESFGMSRAIMAYLDTNDSRVAEFMVNDMPFLQDMDGFMEAVEAAGITEFLLCDNSTGLMERLHKAGGINAEKKFHRPYGESALPAGAWLGGRRKL